LFFVDALRYELGQQLASELETYCTAQDIHTMLAELPTITSVGMNALIPVVKDSGLTPLFDKKEGIVGFQGGERQVKNPGERKATLQDYTGIETSWINLVDFLSFSDRKLNRIVDKNLLVLTALDIDKMGESGALSYGIDYFETGIGRLKTAVIKLKEKGFEEFIITADHGFLLGDESLQINKAPKLSNVDRRHATDTYRNSESLISVKLLHLNYKTEDPDKSFIFERSTHILNTTRKTFYHGGNTLQERLVPVIAFSFTKNLPDSSGSFDLQIRKKPEALGFHRISVLPKPRDGFLFALPEIEIQILSDEGTIIEIGDVVGGKCTGDLLTIPVGAETEILFKLSNGNQPKGQIYFQATKQAISLQNSSFDEFFDVKNSGVLSLSVPTQKKGSRTQGSSTIIFSSEIPEEFHTALAHLNKHGSLSETFLVNTLGGNKVASRKARRFAVRIEEWLPYLPFDLGIELTSEGIEYRKL
ncbi:MAG: PglZ domain-containing protein, partial [Spirochaetales bacterium]|nr:PglZ domain-containing protein [Spirochaetales bacterium]